MVSELLKQLTEPVEGIVDRYLAVRNPADLIYINIRFYLYRFPYMALRDALLAISGQVVLN